MAAAYRFSMTACSATAVCGWVFGSLLALHTTQAVSAMRSAEDAVVSLRVGDLDRSYEVHVPTMPAPASGYPLVLAFHGGGGQARGMIGLTGLDALADRRGLIVIYPNGVDRHWNDGRSTIKRKVDDIAYVSAVLDDVEQHYSVDRGRIFATGISNGALFSQRLGCELATRIAAIAAVAGPMPVELAASCHPARSVAVLQIEGTADPIVPYNGGEVASFGGSGEGGDVLSTDQTVALWSRIDGCAAAGTPTSLPPLALLDDTRVTRTRYEGCSDGAQLELLTVQGGGHTWPGGPQYAPRFIIGKTSRQLDASTTMVDFFLSLPPRR